MRHDRLPLRRFGDMTAAEISAAETGSWIAVLPVAAIEQHGPHLPLATDTIIAEGQINRVIELMGEDIPATFLPVQAIGKSDEHIAFPGTLTIDWNTLAKCWIDIGGSLARAGIRKLIIITSHGGNVPVMDIVARDLRIRHGMLAVATSWARLGQPPALFSPDEIAFGVHGGDIETSLMLHLRPDLVRTAETRDFPSAQERMIASRKQLRIHGPVQFGWMAGDLNPAGTVGNAAAGTAEKGRLSLDHAARAFIDLLADVDNFEIGSLHP